MANNWQKKGKYEQHIRLANKIFEDRNFLAIPKQRRMSALSVLLILLKYVNSKTGKCYPRIQTICDHLGCGRNVVSNALQDLTLNNIITKKKLSSTNLYHIDSMYIVGFKSADYNLNTAVYNLNNSYLKSKDINKTNSIKPSYITTEVDEIISRGLPKELLITELSKLPPDILLSDKKNVYYCKLAMDKKEEVNRSKNLVPVEKILTSLKNVTKKSNSRYIEKVAYNKRNGIKPWEN